MLKGATGQIVGSYSNASGGHGFLLSGGTYTTLDDPLATNGTTANGINALGQIVGGYANASEPACRRQPGPRKQRLQAAEGTDDLERRETFLKLALRGWARKPLPSIDEVDSWVKQAQLLYMVDWLAVDSGGRLDYLLHKALPAPPPWGERIRTSAFRIGNSNDRGSCHSNLLFTRRLT
jgi:hypothetical protein